LTSHRSIDARISNDNANLYIDARETGTTLCRVYILDQPEIFDTFVVKVQSLIEPSKNVTVHEGGLIQFSVNGTSGNEGHRWFSENVQIMEVNSITGVATARHEGRTRILYRDVVEFST
jgi:predicted GNAT superfamily acetyltransferase